MKIIIDISEHDKEWITNGYSIPQELNTDIARKIIEAESLPFDEIRLDPAIIFKALKDGIWVHAYTFHLKMLCIPYLVYEMGTYYFKVDGHFGTDEYYFEDYGKTWALTAKELSNDE